MSLKNMENLHIKSLNLNLSKKIPVVFHNLQNYDSHIIFQKIGKYDFKINVIPKIVEKLMSFTTQQLKKKDIKQRLPLVFIDSIYY